MGNVYTKTGDKGKTGLLGGSRIWKDDLRVTCYGTLDEANSMIGVAYSITKNQEIKDKLQTIQRKLFSIGAELASDDKGSKYLREKITDRDIKYLEEMIDKYLKRIGEQKSFIIPGKTTASSIIHVSRAIIRRAERNIISLSKKEEVREVLLKYINRLSDFLFVLARVEETYGFIEDVKNKVLERLNINNNKENLNLDMAKKMAAAAEKKALDMNIPIVFSVVDKGGNLLLTHRMDEAILASIDISINKAYTSAILRLPTHELEELTKPGDELYGIQWTNENRIVIFGGGFPLKKGSEIIGGIGVSGGTVEQDMIIASHVLRVFELEKGV